MMVLSTTLPCLQNLQETNPQVFEAIGHIAVRCLFHKSGCVWQGLLSESAAHSVGCGYGNSPVYCNRCGVQILHRQVQEHAQTCTVSDITFFHLCLRTFMNCSAYGRIYTMFHTVFSTACYNQYVPLKLIYKCDLLVSLAVSYVMILIFQLTIVFWLTTISI